MMKNKGKWIIISITVAILIMALSVLLICLLLRDNEPDNSHEAEASVSVSEPIQSAIQKKLDFALGDEATQDEILIQIEEKNSFTVVSCEEGESGGVVTLHVYAPNLYEIAKSIDEDKQYTNEAELRNAVTDAIRNAEIVERELNIEFKSIESGYEPILTMEFIDAYYGGIFKLLSERLAENQAQEAEQ